MSTDFSSLRSDIPQLTREVHGRRLVYLDSAATSLTPRSVIEAMDQYYERHHSNVHRAVYLTAEEATAAFEGARKDIASFISAPGGAEEVVFTHGTTEAFNLIAHGWGARHLGPNSAIVLTEMEHHANLVPWFQLRERLGFEIRFLKVTDDFRLDLSNLDELLHGASLISFTGISNVLGTVNPVAEIAKRAHAVGVRVVVDGAQLVAHHPVDVEALGIDAICFGAHKMMGPTGIGAVWAKRDMWAEMDPFMGGGAMIADVSLDGYVPAPDNRRFEAGTPPIAEAVGFAAAIRYLSGWGMSTLQAHEEELAAEALRRLAEVAPGRLRIIGPSSMDQRAGVISLDLEGVHPHDIAQVLDQHGVCVRPGHHCAKPLMKRFGLSATERVSFGPYNTSQDIDVLIDALTAADAMFR